MATTNTHPTFSDPFTTGPDKSGCLPRPLPIQTQNTTSSHNYTDAQTESSSQQDPTYSAISPSSTSHTMKMPDGRRNSQGEVLPCPTDNWKPNFKRVQSWNREEFKRVVYKSEMVDGEHGEGTGFTEGGIGSRKI